MERLEQYKHLIAMAESAETEGKSLAALYPGVRPSWVSGDIADCDRRARQYRQQALVYQQFE